MLISIGFVDNADPDGMKVAGGLTTAFGLGLLLGRSIGDSEHWNRRIVDLLEACGSLLSLYGAALLFAAEFPRSAARIFLIGVCVPITTAAVLAFSRRFRRGRGVRAHLAAVASFGILALALALFGYTAVTWWTPGWADLREDANAAMEPLRRAEQRFADATGGLTSSLRLDLGDSFGAKLRELSLRRVDVSVPEISHDRQRMLVRFAFPDASTVTCEVRIRGHIVLRDRCVRG